MNDLNLFRYLMLSKEKNQKRAGTENVPARPKNVQLFHVRWSLKSLIHSVNIWRMSRVRATRQVQNTGAWLAMGKQCLPTLSTEVTPSWQPTNAAEESAACVSGGWSEWRPGLSSPLDTSVFKWKQHLARPCNDIARNPNKWGQICLQLLLGNFPKGKIHVAFQLSPFPQTMKE